MDVNKNSYTFGFAAIMVIVVATLLSVAAISLKPFQDKNVELEKKQNILNSVGIEVEREAAAEAYELYISESFVVNHLGERTEGDAFTLDLAKELKKAVEEQVFPVFVNEKEGAKSYILPMRGKGLWGPIWGYVALQEDLNTILGAVFDHKGETPGLGAEISLGWFQAPFAGKTIYEGDDFVSIKVVKGGADEDDMHGVDGISGGTITSDGVTDMLQERLSCYVPFFEGLRKEFEVESVLDSLATDSLAVDTLNTLQ
jgi:Na+-transporting NADH:ubiquinone oxidoreductase subunit C